MLNQVFQDFDFLRQFQFVLLKTFYYCLLEISLDIPAGKEGILIILITIFLTGVGRTLITIFNLVVILCAGDDHTGWMI